MKLTYYIMYYKVISAVPQVTSFKLNSSWDFIVVATDGVWDAMTNQEMIAFIKVRPIAFN